MDIPVTRADIDKARAILRKSLPYDRDDPILRMYDAPTDQKREAATFARDWLEALGLDPYDEDDYGDYAPALLTCRSPSDEGGEDNA